VGRVSVTDLLLLDDDGRRTGYLGPELSEDLPPHVLEGLTRRRLVSLGEPCPCGARLVIPNRAARRAATRARRVLHVEIEHEDDCPAICLELLHGRWGA
jgi:hypothetical protein